MITLYCEELGLVPWVFISEGMLLYLLFDRGGGLCRFALVTAAAADLAQEFWSPSAAAAADFSVKVGCSGGSAARLTPLATCNEIYGRFDLYKQFFVFYFVLYFFFSLL